MSFSSGLDAGAGHLTAFLPAKSACFGASLTMLGLVLLALGTARIANLPAQPAQIGRESGTSAHEGRRTPTGFRTVPVESNTFGHSLDVLFAQTGR